MTYLPVFLGVRRKPDAKEVSSNREKLPSKTDTDKALSRDGFACRCCGFQSQKYQHAISLRLLPGQEGARAGELVTVCSFCELTLMLDRAGMTGAGHIIWLPEMDQAELNQAVRALYIARDSQDEALKKAATRTLDVLMARRAEAKKRLGTDDPMILATAFHEQVKSGVYEKRQTSMEGLRFLPLDRYVVRQRGQETNIFPQMMAYWTSPEGPYGKLPVSSWTKLFEDLSAKASS